MMSKFASGIHKPNDQSVLLPTAHDATLSDLQLRQLPGIGMSGPVLWSIVLGYTVFWSVFIGLAVPFCGM
jgi:hypothetical protein